jgi:hypothetical protein
LPSQAVNAKIILMKNKTLAIVLGILGFSNISEAADGSDLAKSEASLIPTSYLVYTAAAVPGIGASLAITGLLWNEVAARQ